MIIEGLENPTLYLYNPVIVTITEADGMVTLQLRMRGKLYRFELFPNIGNIITFDISKIILGMIPEIKTKKSLDAGVIIIDGAYPSYMMIYDSEDTKIFENTFVLGGVKEYKTNVPVVRNDLNLNLNKWENNLAYSFKMLGHDIQGTPIQEANQRDRVKCDNIYLFFRNHKGGFTGYLFEDYDIKESGKNLGYYITLDNIVNSGVTVEKELTVRTKTKREHYEVMQDLSESREIYILENNNLTRIIGGNTFTSNPKISVVQTTMSFGIIHNYNSEW